MRHREVTVIPSVSDSVRKRIIAQNTLDVERGLEPADRFELVSWHRVDATQEPRFMALFEDTDWAFIGSNTRQPIDTMRTRDIRSRMQALFGAPTRTLVELRAVSNLERDQLIEFEYWFVLNDSIPVIILDTNGPWDRGIVLASAASFRPMLEQMKREFLGQLVNSAVRSIFADYYYNFEQQEWYITGYDGASFFDMRIGPPDMARGRPDPVQFELDRQ